MISDVSASVLDIGETDSEATGSDGLLYPASEAHQMAHAGCAVELEVLVATASGESLRSSPDLGGQCKRPAVVAAEP